MKLLAVAGTRPEVVKLGPLIAELKKRGADMTVCSTGQHDRLAADAWKIFGIKPDMDLKLMKPDQSPARLTSRVISEVSGVIAGTEPDAVIVQGDTFSSFGAACAGFYSRVPVVHVEAGLRTFDLGSPYPEEFNRRAISLSASFHFAPTAKAFRNLVAEGIPESRIFLTGNTGLDSFSYTSGASLSFDLPRNAKNKNIVYMTIHRRELAKETMRSVFRAVRRAVEDADAFCVFPVHPAPGIRVIAEESFRECGNAMITGPVGLSDSHALLRISTLCVTDSGGLEEEAAFTGTPAVIVRRVTEREESVDFGVSVLSGTSEETVYGEVFGLLSDKKRLNSMKKRCFAYGDGHASEKIADVIIRLYEKGELQV